MSSGRLSKYKTSPHDNRMAIATPTSFSTSDEESGELLVSGEWSEDGCETVFNSTSTVCMCDHLTHFAILLSARPLQPGQLPKSQLLTLQVTGYVGVSVSLIAMAAVIFVFLFLK